MPSTTGRAGRRDFARGHRLAGFVPTFLVEATEVSRPANLPVVEVGDPVSLRRIFLLQIVEVGFGDGCSFNEPIG